MLGGQIKEPGSAKALLAKLPPLEPPTWPPVQLLACCTGAGRGAGATRAGAARLTRAALLSGAGPSSAMAELRVAKAATAPTPMVRTRFMITPQYQPSPPLT